MQTVKKQMQNNNMQQIQPTTFMFPDGSSDIKLNIDTSNAQGWQLALESSNMVWVFLYIDSVLCGPPALYQQVNKMLRQYSLIYIYTYIIHVYVLFPHYYKLCRLNQTIS